MIQESIDRNFQDVDLTIEFEFSPVIPAYVSGPPEDCYPAEGGECDIISVFASGSEDDLWPILSPEARKYCQEQAEAYAAEYEPDCGPEYEPDDIPF